VVYYKFLIRNYYKIRTFPWFINKHWFDTCVRKAKEHMKNVPHKNKKVFRDYIVLDKAYLASIRK